MGLRFVSIKYLLLFIFLTLPLKIYASAGEWKSYSHSQAKIVSSVKSLAPGDSAYVGLWIKLIPHWHTYWENPGDSGTTPILKWEFPSNTKFFPILWPSPERLVTSGLNTFGYSGEVFLLQKMVAPKNFTGTVLPLKLEAEWLVCDDICVPQNDTFEIQIPIGKTEVDTQLTPLINESLKRSPRTKANISMSWVDQAEGMDLTLTTPPHFEPTDFFPGINIPLTAEKPTIEKINDTEWKLHFKKAALSGARENVFAGLLLFKQQGKAATLQVELPKKSIATLWNYLIWAFLGGLILNLMPCVLPIITLKAFSLLKHSHNGSSLGTVRKESFLYTAGVLISLWALSLIIYFLQNAGRLVGWGFQLQSPYFNLFLILVFIVMGCNLMGLFEFQLAVPQRFQKYLSLNGSQGALATGFLSVIVASPCTAPFMGVAIGFALSQSLPIILLIFSCLGLGLSLPYLLMAFFPQIVRYFPKPGRWMETFKKILAIPMWLTAIWLGYVFFQQVAPAQKEAIQTGLQWENFSEQKIDELRGKHALFIDFTADWCLSCKVNERVVFSDEEVLNTLKKTEIVLIKADWTNYDPVITKWLKKYQRAGVPFYILIDANGKEQILPELLTPSVFLNSLNQLNTKEITP
jgi:DsbC/DsbD-like thiol-disulfide interchange protein/cytochrome c biogenesis protein CcdA